MTTFFEGLASLPTLLQPVLGADSEPAGGAAIGEVILATGGASLATAALFLAGLGHRNDRVGLLGRVADRLARLSGLPAWAALPSLVSGVSLLVAVFGMYWDISLHIDVGRDAGPLANPAHYFILFGLFGIFAAGFLAMVLPKERPSAAAVRITRDWYAPLGGVLIMACGAFSLSGFPLDDVWHRLFGQDVTLWGPTHLMLIGGASMTLVGQAVLLVEGMRARERQREGGGGEPAVHEPRGARSWIVPARRVALTGAFLIGLSTFQAEFDFGVPQFRMVFQPVLIMLAAGAGLTLARVWAGRGAALGAALFFIAVRGTLALLVGPVLGETTPHFPLYLAEAVIVELIALRVATTRPLRFGAIAGLGIGTLGLAAEWGWSHLWMPLPWPSSLLPEGALLGLLVAVAGGLLGGWIGGRLTTRVAPDQAAAPDHAPAPARRGSRLVVAGAAVAVAAVIGYGLVTQPQDGVTTQVTLAEIDPAPQRTVSATVRIDPPAAAEDHQWLTVTAWQGGGLVADRLARVSAGVYRTTEPIPVHGSWKALVRLHSGDSLLGAPIYLPEDRAIPAKAVPAEPSFTRELVSDKEILQREAKEGSATWLTVAAYSTVLAIAVGLLGLLAWGLHRLAISAGAGRAGPRRRPPSAAPRPSRTGAAGQT